MIPISHKDIKRSARQIFKTILYESIHFPELIKIAVYLSSTHIALTSSHCEAKLSVCRRGIDGSKNILST